MGATPAIAVRGLTKRYGALTAVERLDLRIERGETLALLGPNGAGKTTTIECCEGYREPDEGSVEVLGLDPRRDADQLMPRIGVMLQDGGIYPMARPLEVLELFASFHADPLDPRELLERVGLEAHRRTRFRDLSGGQQQRLSLALAVVGRPEVLFLDEPTAGLDVAARRATWEYIEELQRLGVTVVLTTHLLDEAEQLADRVAIVDRGRLVAYGTPAELTHADAREGGVEFTARPGLDVAELARALQAPVVETVAGTYRIDAPNTPALIVALAGWLASAGVTLGELRAGKRSLEEVFLALTADPPPATGQFAGPAGPDAEPTAVSGPRGGAT